MKYFISGCIFWGICALILFAVRPGAKLSQKSIRTLGPRELSVTIPVMAALILLCTLPMSLSPVWNGEIPQHRIQYEMLTESILKGRLDMDYGEVDPMLLAMENPYDFKQRSDLGVSYQWDHAFYEGRYYMYFGVVPVFLLFLPFRIITGTSLTSYHATQVFTALFIVGVFALFYLLSRKFFSGMSWSAYLSLSTAFSAMSVWYMVDAPAMYCTAISAGICMEIWSLYFFANAVWNSKSLRRSTVYGILGSLFGALAFGCRPSVALANLLAVPLFLHYIKGKKWDSGLLKQILAVLSPYVVIAALLMLYNYVRFDNPFEFGQRYQLTVADQRSYGFLSQFDIIRIANGLLENFINWTPIQYTFPYISDWSVFLNCPVCAVACLCLLQKDTLSQVRKRKLTGFMAVLLLLPGLITVSQILMTPYLSGRYRVDIYWLMGLLAFISFGIFGETISEKFKRWYGFLLSILSLGTVLHCFLLWAVPCDSNFTSMYPHYLEKFEHVLWLGFR